jgi:hypothetical protein
VKEVYKLNKFISRQDFLKYVVEEDDLIMLEKGVGLLHRIIYKSIVCNMHSMLTSLLLFFVFSVSDLHERHY